MNADGMRRVPELCEQALARPVAERERYLDQACAGDDDRRAEVGALLAEQSNGGSFLDRRPWAPERPYLAAGSRLGPYEIVAPIGAGGMGEVYKARDTRLGRTVAIKVLPAEVNADPDRRARFEREAKTIAALSHPHICSLFDVGEHPSAGSGQATLFLVMEHLEGLTLAERLAKGPLPIEQALQTGAEIAEGLAAAHRQGVIHRDLKPGNVILTRSGAKLLDFGLAKLRVTGPPAGVVVAAPPTAPPLTEHGIVLGTVPYMSPEQVQGKDADSRSDVFSFGAVLYEMVAGKRPFDGESEASVIAAILDRDPPPVLMLQPVTPPALDRLVRKCLAKDPDARWQSASDIADELRWIAGAGSTPIEAAGAVPSPRAASRWRRVPALLAALLGGAAAGGFLWRGITPTAAPPTVQRFTVSVAEAGLTLTNGGLAISPDGQTLVFAARGSDNDEYLYSRRLDDWRVKKIEGTKGASSPLFNPDGSWVAFLADGLLRKVPMGEGTPQTICELGYQGISRGSWSADDVIITGRWPQQPVRVSAAGGEAKALASTIPAGFYLWPHALPGGSLLLTLNSGAQPRVLALEAGGELRRLLDTPATCARYLPTGHLVYEAEGRLRAAPFDPERLKLVGDSRVVIDDIAITAHAGTAAIDYDVSATGTIAYMAASAAKFRLVWSDRAGRTEPLPLDVRQYAFPSLSRDGRQLTVTVTECTAANVWAGSVDAEPLMPLTSDGYARCSVFSPDGRWIYFGTNPGGAWFGLLRAPSDRSGLPERLLHDQGLQKPTSVSRTGTLLFTAALSNQENAPVRRHIMQMSVERPEAGGTPFGSPRGEEIEATFSPDGRWVAYQSNETGSWQVYVTPFPGPGPRQQVSLEGGMGPQWNPRGNGELFYQTQTALMSARVVGGAPSGRPTALFSWRKHEGYRREFDVAPDGERFLLMEPATPRTEIKLITNWFEELKEKVPVQ